MGCGGKSFKHRTELHCLTAFLHSVILSFNLKQKLGEDECAKWNAKGQKELNNGVLWKGKEQRLVLAPPL